MRNNTHPPALSRRAFLRGAGVTLGLPLLDAMIPFAYGKPEKPRQRMVAICTGLGLHGPFLFPEGTGRSYKASRYLKVLEKLRDDFTIFSGISHPEVDGGHSSEASFLTAAPHPGSSSFKNSISIDQLAAEQLGGETRFDSLTLSTGGNSLSWSRSGVRIPAEDRPSRLFARLFLAGKPHEVKQQVQRLRDGQSIMDTVLGEAKKLQRDLGKQDQAKLEEYFGSVRDLEKKLVKAEEWAKKPKPKVDVPPPQDISDRSDIIGRARLMYDLVRLALQNDSSRIITLFLTATNLVPPIQGVSLDWHNLSHHGKDPQKIEQLAMIEMEELKLLSQFLSSLRATKETNGSLLDQTMVLYGSNLGNASSHDTKNMPILLAGGPFKHGQHLAFDQKENEPLCNLYLMMLQQLGLEIDGFVSSKGTIKGLETKAI